MAMNPETPSKRSREDDEETLARVSEDLKRQKPSTHDNILSLLDEEEEVPVEDLSSIITTLQQELSSSSSAASAAVEGYASSSSSGASSPTCSNPDNEQVEDDSLRVMRHLLEASDDELGIPNIEVNGNGFGPFDDGEEDGFNGLDGFNFGDGLWELEDEAANYYTLVQSELFM